MLALCEGRTAAVPLAQQLAPALRAGLARAAPLQQRLLRAAPKPGADGTTAPQHLQTARCQRRTTTRCWSTMVRRAAVTFPPQVLPDLAQTEKELRCPRLHPAMKTLQALPNRVRPGAAHRLSDFAPCFVLARRPSHWRPPRQSVRTGWGLGAAARWALAQQWTAAKAPPLAECHYQLAPEQAHGCRLEGETRREGLEDPAPAQMAQRPAQPREWPTACGPIAYVASEDCSQIAVRLVLDSLPMPETTDMTDDEARIRRTP
jgi:hypothetical protein